jgi:hypothetical protein
MCGMSSSLHDGKTLAAVLEYMGRKARTIRPRGELRGQGWWPKPEEVRPCCAKTKYPAGRDIWVKLKHCCTGAHIAALFECDEKLMRQIARRLTTTGNDVRREHLSLVWELTRSKASFSEETLSQILAVWHQGCKLSWFSSRDEELALAAGLVRSGIDPEDAWQSAQALSSTE